MNFIRYWIVLIKIKSSLNNSIIYTQSCNIASVYDKPLCYHIVKNNFVWGMDDYDEIENLLFDAWRKFEFYRERATVYTKFI